MPSGRARSLDAYKIVLQVILQDYHTRNKKIYRIIGYGAIRAALRDVILVVVKRALERPTGLAFVDGR